MPSGSWTSCPGVASEGIYGECLETLGPDEALLLPSGSKHFRCM